MTDPSFIDLGEDDLSTGYEPFTGSPAVNLQDNATAGAVDVVTGQPRAVEVPQDTFDIDDTNIVKSPYDNADLFLQAPTVGSIGGLPIKNAQAVDPMLRLKAQLFFDSASEKIDFVRKELGADWEVKEHPNTAGDVVVKRKGGGYWGVIDPNESTFPELIREINENADTVIQMGGLSTGALGAALMAGGTQAVRQGLKKLLMPESEFSAGSVAIDAAAGAITSKTGIQGIKGAVGKVTNKVSKVASKTAGAAKNFIAEGADTSIWQRIKKLPEAYDSAKWHLREWGANTSEFNDFSRRNIEENFNALRKISPEFVEAVKKPFIQDKYDAVKAIRTKAGEAIGESLKDPNKTMKFGDIFDSKYWQQFDEASKTGIVQKGESRVLAARGVKDRTNKIKKDVLTQFGELAFGEGTSPKSIMNLYKRNKLHLEDVFKGTGVKNSDDAMQYLLKEKELGIDMAWLAEQGRQEAVKYGKKKGSIESIHSVRKMIPDAIKDGIYSALRRTDPQAAEDLIQNMTIYSNTTPLAKTLARTVAGGKSAEWNVLKDVPGWMLSKPRFAIALTRNLLQKPEVAAYLRDPTMLRQLGMPQVAGMSTSERASFLKSTIQAGKFLSLSQASKSALLPRDAYAYFEDDALIDNLVNSVQDPDLMDTLLKQRARGDKEGFSNTLSLHISNNEESFAPAPLKSIVMNGDKVVVTDKFDRETLRKAYEKIPDPMQRYQALKMLNGSNEMIEAPFEPPKEYKELPVPERNVEEVRALSAISKTASNLKKSDTITLEDGSQRQDYDH